MSLNLTLSTYPIFVVPACLPCWRAIARDDGLEVDASQKRTFGESAVLVATVPSMMSAAAAIVTLCGVVDACAKATRNGQGCPHTQQLAALRVGCKSIIGLRSKKPDGTSLKPQVTTGCTGKSSGRTE